MADDDAEHGVKTVLVMAPSPARPASRVVVSTSARVGRRTSVVSIIRASSVASPSPLDHQQNTSTPTSTPIRRSAPSTAPLPALDSLPYATGVPDVSEALATVHDAFLGESAALTGIAEEVQSTAQLLFSDEFEHRQREGTGIFSTRIKRQRVPLTQVKALYERASSLVLSYGLYLTAACMSVLPHLSRARADECLAHMRVSLEGLREWRADLASLAYETKALKNKFVVRSNLSAKAAKVNKVRVALDRERQSDVSPTAADSDTISRAQGKLMESNRDVLAFRKAAEDDDGVYIPELRAPEPSSGKKGKKKTVRMGGSKRKTLASNLVNENGIHQFAILANHEAEGTWSIRTLHRDQVSVNVISFLANEAHSALSNKHKRQAMLGEGMDRTGSQVKGAMDAREFFRTAAMYKKRHEAATEAKEKQRAREEAAEGEEKTPIEPWHEETSEVLDEEHPMLDIVDPEEFKLIATHKKDRKHGKRLHNRGTKSKQDLSKRSHDPAPVKMAPSAPIPFVRAASDLSEGSTVRFARREKQVVRVGPRRKSAKVKELENRLAALHAKYNEYEQRTLGQEADSSHPCATAERVVDRLWEFSDDVRRHLEVLHRLLVVGETGEGFGTDRTSALQLSSMRVAGVNTVMNIAHQAGGGKLLGWLLDVLDPAQALQFVSAVQVAMPLSAVEIWTILPPTTLTALRSIIAGTASFGGVENGKGKEKVDENIADVTLSESTVDMEDSKNLVGASNSFPNLPCETQTAVMDALESAATRQLDAIAPPIASPKSPTEQPLLFLTLWQDAVLVRALTWVRQLQLLCIELARSPPPSSPSSGAKLDEQWKTLEDSLDRLRAQLYGLGRCRAVLRTRAQVALKPSGKNTEQLRSKLSRFRAVLEHVEIRVRPALVRVRAAALPQRAQSGGSEEREALDSASTDEALAECISSAGVLAYVVERAITPIGSPTLVQCSPQSLVREMLDHVGGLERLKSIAEPALTSEHVGEFEASLSVALSDPTDAPLLRFRSHKE